MKRLINSLAARLTLLKVLSAIVAIIVQLLLVELLGAPVYGYIALVLAVAFTLASLCRLGAENQIMRASQYGRGAIHQAYLRAVVLALALAVILAAAAIATPWLTRLFAQLSSESSYYIIALLVLSVIQSLNSAYFQALEKPVVSSIFSGPLFNIVTLVAIVTLQPDSLDPALWLLCACQLSTCLLSSGIVIKLLYSSRRHIGWPTLTNTGVDGNAYTMIALTTLTTQQGAQLITGHYASLSELAMLAIAIKASQFLSYPLVAVNKISAAKFARLAHQGQWQEVKMLAARHAQGLTVFALVAYVGLVIGYMLLSSLTAFAPYQVAYHYLLILGLGQVINLASGSVITIMLMGGLAKQYTYLNLALAAGFLFALFALVPWLGGIGACIAIASVMALRNMLAIYYVRTLLFRDHYDIQ
ncbi:lipopolysaccharide biosynthesis protein [Pseudoalteromonas ruthenica]|uniref:lipopolysaccharide biosynthesis protein n=1 Tax=Pseudoalteromonas ruthenica TaxID=151081 RepID=UPI000349C2E7|nr:hypothetical protein [Pseudoalteromonas ruthenica]